MDQSFSGDWLDFKHEPKDGNNRKRSQYFKANLTWLRYYPMDRTRPCLPGQKLVCIQPGPVKGQPTAALPWPRRWKSCACWETTAVRSLLCILLSLFCSFNTKFKMVKHQVSQEGRVSDQHFFVCPNSSVLVPEVRSPTSLGLFHLFFYCQWMGEHL